MVLASFTATGPEPHLYRGDREGDGLSIAKDACPFSPRGLKPLLAGCNALDLLNGADALIANAGDAVDAARQLTLGVKGLKVTGRDLSAVMDLIEAGAVDASEGDPCGGAATIGKGARLLAKANAPLSAMQKQLAKQPPPNGEGDADETDLRLAGLHYRQGLLAQAADKVAKLQRAYAAVCGDLGAKVTLVGQVAKTKDAEKLLQLRTGELISLAGADYDADGLWEGARVRAVTHKIGSGAWLAESVVALDKDLGTIQLKPCVELRIAPVQEFGKPNPILHSPKGYSFNNVLRLEAGMRVAASPKCANGKSGRYTLTIVMSSSTEAHAVAIDLDSNDPPGAAAGRRQRNLVERQGVRAVSGQQLPTPVVEPVVVSQRTNDGGGDQELPLSDQAHLDDQVHGSCPRPRRLRPCRVREDDLPARKQRAPDHQCRGDLPAPLHDPAVEGDLRGRGLQAGRLARPARHRQAERDILGLAGCVLRRAAPVHARHDRRRSLRRPDLAADRRHAERVTRSATQPSCRSW